MLHRVGRKAQFDDLQTLGLRAMKEGGVDDKWVVDSHKEIW
jgi:hypothetical protein